MGPESLQQPEWRIDVYSIKTNEPYPAYITDFSTIYTSDLTITKQRNYPDEISFTIDLVQLQNRADMLQIDVASTLEPYKNIIKVYRNNVYVTQGIVQKTSINLNNSDKNTIEVQCADILSIFEKRLIHQDYAEGSWADFAKQVVMDAQHEPNRIYNYAFEGDGTGIDNVWFRGWQYTPPESLGMDFKDWEPGITYQMYAHVTYNGKFWECNETHISEDKFSETYWEEIGWTETDREKDFAPVYAVWREDDEEEGPTKTKLGGWGGTSSCHMSAGSFRFNSPFEGTIELANSKISTTLVAPFPQKSAVPHGYTPISWIESTGTQYIDTGIVGKNDTTVQASIAWSNPLDTDQWLIGATNSSNQAFCPIRRQNVSDSRYKLSMVFGDNVLDTENLKTDDNRKIEVVSAINETNQQMDIDGVNKIDNTLTYPINTDSMYIFGINKNGSPDKLMSSRLYSMKIWQKNTTTNDNDIYVSGDTVYYNVSASTFKANAERGMSYEFSITEDEDEPYEVYRNGLLVSKLASQEEFNRLGITVITKKAPSSITVSWGAMMLARDFVPAIRDYDKKPGLFDKISQEFFTNDGEGEFKHADDNNASLGRLYTRIMARKISALPKEYQAVEYLEATGGQYIVSGVSPTVNTRIVTEVSYDDTDADMPLFGSRNGIGSNEFVCWLNYVQMGQPAISFVDGKSFGEVGYTATNIPLGEKAKYDISYNGIFVNDEKLVNTQIGSISGSPHQIRIFGMYDNDHMDSRYFHGRIYSFKIYTGTSNVLRRNFIPCVRKSDGEAGFYDSVEKVFYTNQGTGKFKTPLNSRWGMTQCIESYVEFEQDSEGKSNVGWYEVQAYESDDGTGPNVLKNQAIETNLDGSEDPCKFYNIFNILDDDYTTFGGRIPDSTCTGPLSGWVRINLDQQYNIHSLRILSADMKESSHAGISNSRHRVSIAPASFDDMDIVYDDTPGDITETNGLLISDPERKQTFTEDLIFVTFIEGKNPGEYVESKQFRISETDVWKKIEYTFPEQDFDIYRYGVKIISGEGLFDSPVAYKEQLPGDEWDLNVRVGDFPSAAEQTDAGWMHNRFTATFEWKNAKETLQDLANMDADNFWFWIDESYRFNVYINPNSTDMKLDLSYPKNITSISVSSDASDIVNYIKGDGSAEVKQDPTVSGIQNSNSAPFTWIGYNVESMKKYWPLAKAVSYDSERLISNLREDIETDIKTYSDIQDVPEIVVENGTINPAEIMMGDIVGVSVLDNPYVRKVSGLYKIIGMKTKIDTNSVENVSLTLIVPSATQLNTLTFPRIIKIIMNRTKY